MSPRPRSIDLTAGTLQDPPVSCGRPVYPGSTFTAVIDLVVNRLRSIGRRAARRWNADPGDGEQEALAAAWDRHRRGLPLELVVRYVEELLMSPSRSPLRDEQLRREERFPTRSGHVARRAPGAQASDDVITAREARGLFRIFAGARSAMGPMLDRLEAEAPPRCPGCRSIMGSWVSWSEGMGPGIRQDDEDHRRRAEALLEPGSAAAEEAGRRKARDTQVWLCGAGLSEEERRRHRCCGRWTYEPLFRAQVVGRVPPSVRPRPTHTLGRDTELQLLRYAETGRLGGADDGDTETAVPFSAPPGYPVDSLGRRRGA